MKWSEEASASLTAIGNGAIGRRAVNLLGAARFELGEYGQARVAFARALELSEKDGSIVLSAGSMFVTAEVMRAWNQLMSLRGAVVATTLAPGARTGEQSPS